MCDGSLLRLIPRFAMAGSGVMKINMFVVLRKSTTFMKKQSEVTASNYLMSLLIGTAFLLLEIPNCC